MGVKVRFEIRNFTENSKEGEGHRWNVFPKRFSHSEVMWNSEGSSAVLKKIWTKNATSQLWTEESNTLVVVQVAAWISIRDLSGVAWKCLKWRKLRIVWVGAFNSGACVWGGTDAVCPKTSRSLWFRWQIYTWFEFNKSPIKWGQTIGTAHYFEGLYCNQWPHNT